MQADSDSEFAELGYNIISRKLRENRSWHKMWRDPKKNQDMDPQATQDVIQDILAFTAAL
jgi:hypothetical protein